VLILSTLPLPSVSVPPASTISGIPSLSESKSNLLGIPSLSVSQLDVKMLKGIAVLVGNERLE
jgi:hypothetical protein